MILKPKKIKSVTVSTVESKYCSHVCLPTIHHPTNSVLFLCLATLLKTYYSFVKCYISPCSNHIFELPVAKCSLVFNQFSSVQFSCSVVSDSLRPHESQHARPPGPSSTPRVHSDSSPSSPWCHPVISSSVIPSPPAPNPSQHQSLFQWVNSLHEVAKVLEFQL